MKGKYELFDFEVMLMSHNDAIQALYDKVRFLEMTQTPLKEIQERLNPGLAMTFQSMGDLSVVFEKIQPESHIRPFLSELSRALNVASALYIDHMDGILEDLKKDASIVQVLDQVKARLEVLDFGMISPFHISLLKISRMAREMMQPSEEFLKQINYLNIDAAKELLLESDIDYDSGSKKFIVAGESVSTNRINIVAKASILFDDISLKDMHSLFTCLSETPSLALDHPVGKQIFGQTKKLKSSHMSTIKRGRTFYRGREHNQNEPPFLEHEMRKAPYGISGQGRYSSSGIPAFYLSDDKEGAATEVRIHTRTAEYNIQIGTFVSNREIDVVDVRDWGNAMSSYFFFQKDDSDRKLDTAYIIPNFFADCLKRNHIEGLIYKSRSEKYNNYVVWKDSGFDYRPDEIEFVSKEGGENRMRLQSILHQVGPGG